MRLHAQRKHVVHSLDTLLYQLHTLSYLLSPTLFIYLCRTLTQITFSRPREIESQRSLAKWFGLVIIFNTGALWMHAAYGAADGAFVVLDFVGAAYTPSKSQLLCLDFTIVALQLLLTFIAYENSSAAAHPADTPDNLLPLPSPHTSSTPIHADDDDSTKHFEDIGPAYVIDIRLSNILRRLRSSPPPSPPTNTNEMPLPNTTPLQLPGALRMVMRARAQRRARDEQGREREAGTSRTVPGAMDPGND